MLPHEVYIYTTDKFQDHHLSNQNTVCASVHTFIHLSIKIFLYAKEIIEPNFQPAFQDLSLPCHWSLSRAS